MSQDPLSVVATQIDCAVGDIEQNCETIVASIADAAAKGCDLLVLPEMVDTGYDMSAIRNHAGTWEGPLMSRLREAAREAGIHVICGVSERIQEPAGPNQADTKCIYNAAVVLSPGGQIAGRYHKTHLFSLVKEDEHLAPGEFLTIVPIGGFQVGIIICYDIRFPELARSLALEGMDALVVISAWPAARIAHLKALTVARAIENQVYVVLANRIGTDDSLAFGGCSRIVAPDGAILCEAGETGAESISALIDAEVLIRVRDSMAIYDDRRPDLYG